MIKKKKKLIAEEMPEFHSDIEAMPMEDKIFVDKSVEIVDYIFQLMEEKGMKQKDLADKMEKTEAEVSKILGGMHNLTLRSISKLEAALGGMIVCTPNAYKAHILEDRKAETFTDVVSKVPEKTSPKMDYESGSKVISMFKTGSRNKEDCLQEAKAI